MSVGRIAGSGWPGSTTWIEVPGGCPPGTVSSTRSVPPCLTTTCFTMARPRPEPGIARADVELNIVAAPSNSLQGPVHPLGHVDGLVDDAARLVTGQIHQIAHQRGQFL